MNPMIRNILAVLTGIIIGSLVNMGIIMLSSSIIPPPEGADVSSMESLKRTMHLFEAKHFIFPFLAHAVGTLVGALVAAMITTASKMRTSLIVGGVFLFLGLANCYILPAPVWYIFVDLLGAYIPMAYLGYRCLPK